MGTLQNYKLNKNLSKQIIVPSNYPTKKANKGSVFNSVYKFGLDIPPDEKYIELPIRSSSQYKQEILFEDTTYNTPYAWINPSPISWAMCQQK